MIDPEHPKARYHPGWTILGTLGVAFVVLLVIAGQAATNGHQKEQISQQKELSVYLRAENDAARVRHEQLARQLNEAVAKIEPAVARNEAALARINARQGPPRPVKPAPRP